MEALPEALELAPSLDLDLTEHRARCVRNVDLSEADLVLGFEYQHLAAAVTEGGARRERTFTVPELVTLLEEAGRRATRRPRSGGAAGGAAGGRHRPGGRRPEIADPFGASPEVFRGTAHEVRALTERLAELLFGVRSQLTERSAGNRITSLIVSRPVSTIVSRSMPSPRPPVGGIPYASAST